MKDQHHWLNSTPQHHKNVLEFAALFLPGESAADPVQGKDENPVQHQVSMCDQLCLPSTGDEGHLISHFLEVQFFIPIIQHFWMKIGCLPMVLDVLPIVLPEAPRHWLDFRRTAPGVCDCRGPRPPPSRTPHAALWAWSLSWRCTTRWAMETATME